MKKFWYEKHSAPEELKEALKGLVRGEEVDTVWLSDGPRKLLRTDGKTFRKVFLVNRKYLYRGDYTAPPGENDYGGASNFLTEDGLAGFSLSAGGWLTSLYSNLPVSGFARAVKPHILAGINKLVCIFSGEDEDSSGLVRFYKKEYGYVPYARTVDDRGNMSRLYGDRFIEDFVAKHGVPRHVFLVDPACHPEPGKVYLFDDYFDAEDFVDLNVPYRKEVPGQETFE